MDAAAERGIELRLLTLKGSEGLAKALDKGIASLLFGVNLVLSRPLFRSSGLEVCSCEMVARMDVDDICAPERLGRQFRFLESEEGQGMVAIGGQASVSLHRDGGVRVVPRGDGYHGQVAMGIPCHPLLVEWEMPFRCPIIHPSVMLRRSAVLSCGGYSPPHSADYVESTRDTSEEEIWPRYIEDYWLWCRLLERLPSIISSILLGKVISFIFINWNSLDIRAGWRTCRTSSSSCAFTPHQRASWKRQIINGPASR